MGYIIYGKSKFGKEEIDTAEDLDEAHYLVGEYRMAYGSGWTFQIKISE